MTSVSNFTSDIEARALKEESSRNIANTTSLSNAASTSSADSTISSTLAKELALPDQHGRNDALRQLTRNSIPLRTTNQHMLTRAICHSDLFFTVYRKMFAAIFLVNATAFIVFVAESKGYPTLSNVKNATSANILASVMMRQENVVNFLYEAATCVPLSTPFFIRRKLAKVYHYGGVHSGCGVAAVVWFLLYTALTTRDFIQKTTSGLPVANIVTCYVLITMYLLILMGAYPRFRIRFHDYFEAMHRFAGWASFLILWAQTFILAEENSQKQRENIGIVLVRNPGFWFLLISTFFIALSWGRLRHREVEAEVLSSHGSYCNGPSSPFPFPTNPMQPI